MRNAYRPHDAVTIMSTHIGLSLIFEFILRVNIHATIHLYSHEDGKMSSKSFGKEVKTMMRANADLQLHKPRPRFTES